ncbi:hypothetical protein ACLOJK_002666 [Asimina triloba]
MLRLNADFYLVGVGESVIHSIWIIVWRACGVGDSWNCCCRSLGFPPTNQASAMFSTSQKMLELSASKRGRTLELSTSEMKMLAGWSRR